MTNAEQKAKELANRLDGANPKQWNALITTALREAGNAKLEEAAALLERNRDYMLERRRDANAHILAKLASEFASDICSLAEKD